MNQTLNQDEIDSLLSVPQEDKADDNALLGAGPRIYDLSNNDKNIYNKIATIGLINEKFARNIRVTLNNFLKREVEVVMLGLKIAKFQEYINTLFIPTSLNIVKINPLKGLALFVADSKLVFSLVDNYFGGEGKLQYKSDAKDFTETENRITQLLTQAFFKDFKDAWQSVIDLNLEYKSLEVNPAMANIINLDELLIISKFHFELDGGGGDYHICMPYAMIEPIRELLNANIKGERDVNDGKWVQRIREEILEANVQATCVLTQKKVSLRDVMHFKAGDIIEVEIPEEITLRVTNTPVFSGSFGTYEGKYAIKINERLKKSAKG